MARPELDQLGSVKRLWFRRHEYFALERNTKSKPGRWLLQGYVHENKKDDYLDVLAARSETELGHLALYGAYVYQTTGTPVSINFDIYPSFPIRECSDSNPYTNIPHMSDEELEQRIDLLGFATTITDHEQVEILQTALLTIVRFNNEYGYHKKMRVEDQQ